MLYWLISFICQRWIGGAQATFSAQCIVAGQCSPLSSACDKLANEERPSHFHKLINPAGTETNYNIYVISSRICLQVAHPYHLISLFRRMHAVTKTTWTHYYAFKDAGEQLIFYQHYSWFSNTNMTSSTAGWLISNFLIIIYNLQCFFTFLDNNL